MKKPKTRKKAGWEKLVTNVPKPLKAYLLELADSLGLSLAEYHRGILIEFARDARKQKV